MTRGRGSRLGGAAAVIAAAFAAAGGAAAAGSALDLYYERTLMVAADGRCRLFDPQLGAALGAARAQARGAALRSGIDEAAVAQVRGRAQAKAASVACRSRDLTLAAARVRSAFEGYSRMTRMTYPGQIGSWLADRGASIDMATWRLSQGASIGADRVIFGLAAVSRAPPTVTAAGAFAGGRWPYAARLVMRDPVRAPKPRLGGVFSRADGRTPLSQRLPSRGATRTLLAYARSRADPLLAPPGTTNAVMFRFPAEAAARLAALDPREAAALQFVFAGQGRDEVRTAYLEVGDFAAGQAFLTVTPLTVTPR